MATLSLVKPHSVYITKDLPPDERNDRKWKLAPHHIADLRDVARGVEETDAGICCKYLIDSRSGLGADFDEVSLNDLEHFCERARVWEKEPQFLPTRRDKLRRCKQAVARLYRYNEHKSVALLFITYGHPDPMIREFPKQVLDCLGELASLARYSDTVEQYRKEMARLEGVRIYQNDNTVVSEVEQRAEAFRHNLKPDTYSALVSIMHVKDRVEWADKAISSGDALRSMFAPLKERGKTETLQHYQERKDNTESKRDEWMLRIKRELLGTFESAGRKYHMAWLASSY